MKAILSNIPLKHSDINMNTDKFLENLKYEARSFALWDKYIEANVLDAIVRALEDSFDKQAPEHYTEDEQPF